MYGFYRSWYINENGNTEYLATTQFQPTDARKVFPCFDEPGFKAKFDISIKHPKQYSAYSNTPGTRSDDSDPNYVLTTFKTTPKMSTYLIAFVVSDFTCETSPELLTGDIKHSVCSRKETENLRTTALDVGPKIVNVLEQFTGIPYSDHQIGKMDQFAIPDFSAGAMENWGLLTYREAALLWDPKQSSNSYKQSITNIVAHEIAHMWFGNLVTTHWWSDTFLNEGFATLFQYFATHEVEKSWELDKQFVTAQIHPMLVKDAQPLATALSHNVSSQSEISARFGSVSYNKGASVLRMLEHVMEKANFKLGIQKYLSEPENKFGSTTPKDLWTALQTHAVDANFPTDVTLPQVMQNWIEKPGFPLLTVSKQNNGVSISQQRFLVSGEPNTEDKWYVPITYTLSSDTDKFENTKVKTWLTPDGNLEIKDIIKEKDDWIVLNNQQTGFYRIHYDDVLRTNILNALKSKNFSGIIEINRAEIVDDIYNLAAVGILTYKEVFNFFEYLKNETSYYPWYAAINGLSNMLQRTSNTKIRSALSTRFLELMKTLLDSVPFDQADDNNQIYTFNRVQANTWACRLSDETCLAKSETAFQNYKNTSTKPDKNMKSIIYCNGLRRSKNQTEDFNFLWKEYKNTKLATEQATILSALGCATDPTVVKNFLLKSIQQNSGIRQQDASSVFSNVYSQNLEGIDIAFDFLLEHHQDISDYYGSMNALSNLFSGLASRFTNQEQVDKLKNFLKTTEGLSETLVSAAEAAVASADANLKWIEGFEKQLTDIFFPESNTADSVKVSFATVLMTFLVIYYQM